MEKLNELIEKAKTNHQDSIEELVGYYMPLLKSAAWKLSMDKTDREDFLQDAKLIFLELLNSFDPKLSNFGYYVKISLDKALYKRNSKYLHDKYNSKNIEQQEWLIDEPDLFERINYINDLARAIELLPDKQKLAIKLYYLMELPQDHCSKLIGIKQSAFSRLLRRALKNLKKTLI